MKNTANIQLESQLIRNLATKSGNNLSDNTDRIVLNFTKEEILKMSDSEIKSKINLDTYYEHNDYCGIIYRIIEVNYIENEDCADEIENEFILKEFTYIEDGAWPNDFEMSNFFKD